ncbi:MAG: RnfABCDGE type electron transport complex subunit D [Oscillospiraceae bacterium]
MKNLFTVSPSPHIHTSMNTSAIMLNVIIALVPAVIASVCFFGLYALFKIAVCVVSCVIFEFGCCMLRKKPNTTGDFSAAVTGLLLGLNLPVSIPVWMAVIGSFAAIVIVKQLFGGLGQNFANPAITARIILMLSFTTEMTTWAKPLVWINIMNSDFVMSSATPLVSGTESYFDLFIGNVPGCMGETSALALLIGGIYLMARKIITPSAPLSFIGTVALLTFITGGDPLYQILSGGLFLGAFFMATDYATTPLTEKGRIIFGIGCGIITFVIRNFGNMPEGVSFSILLMNILTPYIDEFTRNRAFGEIKEEKTNA